MTWLRIPGAIVLVSMIAGCSAQKPNSRPVSVASPSPAQQPGPAAAGIQTPAYSGTMHQVMDQYTADVGIASERIKSLNPSLNASSEQVVLALVQQAALYLTLRYKLTGLDPRAVPVLGEREVALMHRAARSNGELREKGLQACDNAVRAWTIRCERELEGIDGVLAERDGRASQVAEVDGVTSSSAAEARGVLASLEALRGSSWLAGRLARAGVSYRPGMFGKPSQALASCPVLASPLAPMGPIASNGAAEPLPRDLELPTASGVSPALGEGLRIYLSKSALFVGRERQRVLDLGPDAGKAGFGAKHKSSPNDLLLLPLRDLLSQRTEPRAAEVLVFVDKSVPFRPLLEVLFTVGQASFENFLLVSRAEREGEIAGFALSGAVDGGWPVAVLLVNDGYGVRVDGHAIGEKCGQKSAGIAVPKLAGSYDTQGLVDCLKRVDETIQTGVGRALITANPGTRYEELMKTISAITVSPYRTIGIGAAP